MKTCTARRSCGALGARLAGAGRHRADASVAVGEPIAVAAGEIALGAAPVARLRLRKRAAGARGPRRRVRDRRRARDEREFARFVAAGSYDDAALWPGDAGRWRARHAASQPARWRRDGDGAWQMRWFDRWQQLDADAPAIHVSAWEAEAYCRWAGAAAERGGGELAALAPRFRWGHGVWDWTRRLPAYPGFVAGPYADYSKPWFGDHRELRGGSFATHARLHDPRYRNFFVADRGDVFAGFRTASPQR